MQGIRQFMPVQAPTERIHNFNEVALGYEPSQAIEEASRCLQCKKPGCMKGCPVEIDIPAFLGLTALGKFQEAISKIKEKNNLPAICGRVCPQETQCEIECVLGKKGEPCAIGRLERFVADYELRRREKGEGRREPPIPHPSSLIPKKVAVIGSGPAGLTAAADLARFGHKVTIFESLHAPGGVLRYGIPEFRLPKSILDKEVHYIESLGVRVLVNMVVGKIFNISDLFKDGFSAVFIGTGAGLPHFLDIPGENLNGVYSANEFLTRVNLMKGWRFPEYDTPVRVGERVAVVGAGNVAMDAARCALRLGAEEVYIVYRRGRDEMPAREEEIRHAEEEGVVFKLLTQPVRVIGDKGWVKALECLKMELGEPDSSGRRRPIPIPNSEFVIKVETMIPALGQGPNPLLLKATSGLKLGEKGTVVADEDGTTSTPGVWAGGDIVTGAATVISAMGAGKKAASSINRYLGL